MKTLIMKSVLVILMTGLFTIPATAQNATNESVKAGMLADWERAKAYTKEYLDAMPADGVNFKASPEVRSFAEQMLHISQANIGLAANGTGQKTIYADKNLEKMDEYKTKDALSKIVLESYDFVINGIKNMDTGKFGNKVKWNNLEVTRMGWINKAFEHQTHHRGQCTIYLRLKGVTPPQEKLF